VASINKIKALPAILEPGTETWLGDAVRMRLGRVARTPRRLLKRPNLTEDGCIENREQRSHAHKNGRASARPSPHT
jgi:hypothetical protein